MAMNHPDKTKKWTKTISLPSTSLPMKANLVKKEPDILAYWQENTIYHRATQRNTNQKKTFILHDGPPYANGNFHVGHALNKILKDTLNKYYILKGYRTHYIPGWDCHGLPIEIAVLKQLSKEKGGSRKDIKQIRQACRDYAKQYILIQAQEQSRMGVFWDEAGAIDFKNQKFLDNGSFYYTMSKQFEVNILKAFKELFTRQLIYKGEKPIHWCISCATALAEAEIEYAQHSSKSIYVAFPVENTIKGFSNCFVAIWTTTPWTLPANLAIAFHPSSQYAIYETPKGNMIIAVERAEEICAIIKCSATSKYLLTKNDIEILKVRHPFLFRESKVIFGEHVTMDVGTGIVHTAPGHGHDDYLIGLQYDLEPYCPVDHRGRYTSDFPEMEGEKIFASNDTIINKLEKLDVLLAISDLEHSYPHCWRCHKPVIFRATEQWFFSIEPLKELAIEASKKTKWIPDWGENRFISMIENRPDWCLSRQRIWGVPIPEFQCNSCGHTYMTVESLENIVQAVEEKGIEVWFEKEAKDFLPAGYKCSECASQDVRKGQAILDVWFDSGVTWYSVLKNNPLTTYPADLYLEGSDQHRGWFQSSLWTALGLTQQAPFKQVLTHGYVLDENNRAMSKSRGNVINPITQIIPKYGADILRLWVASEDYRTDNTIGFHIMDQLSDSYRKIRNTFRYILGNLQDTRLVQEPDSSCVIDPLDLWVLHQVYLLEESINKAYSNYELHIVYHKILQFCITTLSQTYFDIIRDRLYCNQNPLSSTTNHYKKYYQKCQSSLHTLSFLLRYLNSWLAPILSFSMEEINLVYNTKSIFELEWPSATQWCNKDIHNIFTLVFNLKNKVNIQLEKLRTQAQIGSSIDAQVSIPNNIKINKIDKLQLQEYLIVSHVAFYNGSEIIVEVCTENKCERCWLHQPLNRDNLCNRCEIVTQTI